MKLKDYIASLKKFIKDNPGSEELTVIYSRDDEGNGFQEVYYTPSMGIWEEREDFISNEEDLKNREEEINAVCIN